VFVNVHADHFCYDPVPVTIPGQYPKVITPPAAYLTDPYPSPASKKLLQPKDADPVTAQPGIDQIQLQHIPFDVGKWNAVLIEYFLLEASLGKSGHAISFRR
jgi:hypothetical protein